MGGSALYLVAVFAFYFPAVSHSQLYSLITPNVLRVESEEKVVVEAHGLNAPIAVTVTVHDFPLKEHILYQVQTDLNPANGMMGTAVIKVPTKNITKDSKQNQYVVVQAKFPQQTLEKVVLVHFHSGYIFIQTDKTIYTPGSTVLYRIFTVGHKLEPVSKRVIVEFETPESIIVKQIPISAALKSGIFSLSHNLPEIISLGTWKIMARYEDSPQQTFSAQFDVKEYVLPSFEVILEPSEKFLYIDGNEDFRVSITARYLYEKKLDGNAFVLFGVKMDDEKRSIPQSLKRISIEDGEGKATLTRAMLKARFANLNELVGHSLYVSVTILTESGSNMVEAERTGIKIVTSPYQIHFTKTPKYFKPGMPFELMVYVTNPDGSPAPHVPVQAEGFQSAGLTQGDGTAKLIINMPRDRQQVSITVKTAHPNLPANRQASKSMVAEAYQSQGGSQNYLHLAVTASELKPGDNLPVNFHLKSNNPAVLNQIQYFTYIILNKGKIFRVGRQARQAGQNLVTMSLPITPDLIPSFRIVAYYQVGNLEIVADSVWLDIQDTCMGTLVVKGASDKDRRIHEPGTPMKLKLEGDHRAYVGLVAVDKGVYVLNENHKITQSKIWDSVEKSDIGCTAGSGKNNLGVFTDAGLALETSNRISTAQRTDPECPQATKRQRRSVQLIEYKANKVADYQDRKLKKCCEDGMYKNSMGHSCEKRVGYILDTDECKKTFLNCCNYIKTIHDKLKRELHLELARSDLDEDFMSDEDIFSRSQFPESWLWQVEQLIERPNELGISSKTLSIFLKDSITTLEVLAVSLSETKGICVADPYEIKVMKNFFIDLRLPYSVVRNEHVEIQAILYNYWDQNLKVWLELMYNPVFCSASTSEAKYRQILDIKAKSSLAVPLVIVPLQLGSHNIEVKAAVQDSFVSDGVKKKLKVVPEGMKTTKTIMSVLLDPSMKGAGGVQEMKVKAADIDDIVPDTESETKIRIQGNPVTMIVENSIDGTNLKHLILTPSGSGEENMIGMTAPIIATIFLDSTEQWERIGVERRAEAIKLIMRGYTQQMVYKKPDFSYAAFKDRPASTWLTAYVVKVFALAKKLVLIENQVICGAVKWLILKKQKLDGGFQEDAPVIHEEMIGGYKGAEPDVSLTAFVMVALEEAKDICKDQVNSLDGSISKAADYLAQRYQSLTRPYTVALASYALAMVGKLNTEKTLMRASKEGNRWEEPNTHNFNMEGTSYALLALLKMKKYELAGPIVKWLREQNYYGGGYGSTQATIMVFQALAQYWIDIPQHKDMNLFVSIFLSHRATPIKYRISNENALVARTAELMNEDFTVKAEGTGQATVTVTIIYNAKLKEDESQCKKFDLRVSVKEARGVKKPEGAMRSVYIKICIRFLGVVDATMSIINVSMLTGFSPDVEDLKRLSQGVNRYISKYEIDKAPLDRGNLRIYLDKVSHREDECLQFKAHQFFEVRLIQPASVTVYDYYTIDDRCTKFYHPSNQSGLFNMICHGGICRCAEESCFMQQKIEGPITLNRRMEEACQPGVDYVYKTRLVRSEEVGGSDSYTMDILEIIKAGFDENPQGKTRQFISHIKCRESLRLELNKDYLIWGLRTDLWPRKAELSYIIGKDTWIEKWPNEDECQESDFQKLCQEFLEFSETMTMFGCPT
ncbi:A.superbus venom factor 1-like [Gopherus flavomarginatus]|uniref:A.superbus venom factor 1-like n=1 Tax=Gopherus flavomarginatus TaxID=286002 RepID=UPI0021CBB8FB|nr:A.superbus venom factor 1-like [Gopherus flavomarginatus]